MKSPRNAVLLALLGLALVAGALGLWCLRGPGPGGEGLATGTETQPTSVGAITTAQAQESRPERAPVPIREELAARGESLDPDYQAALAGFRGRVVTHDRQPAADKRVRLYRVEASTIILPQVNAMADTTIDPRIDVGTTTSASDGTFTIPGAYPGSGYFLVADVDGDTPTFRIVERSPGPGEVVDLGDIELRDTATVTGVVVDGDGKPVAGALVRAIDLPGAVLAAMPLERFDPAGALILRALPDSRSPAKIVFDIPAWIQRRFDELPLPKTRTDREGKFTLRGVDPGVNAFMITRADLASFVNPTLRVKAGQVKDVGTVKLEPGESVQGRVVDAKGEPVVGAEVLVAQTSAAAPVDLALRAPKTDEKGRFASNGLKPGQVTVAVRRSAHDPWTVSDPAAVGTDVTVTLPTVATLTVRVKSAAGRAIEAPRVKLFPSEAEEPWALMGFVTALDLGDRVETLPDGALRIRALAVGSYRVVLESREHAPGQLLVTLMHDQEVTIELQAQETVRVLTVDARGTPVRGVELAMVSSNQKTRREFLPLHAGKSAADGHIDIVIPVDTKELRLSATHPRFAQTNLTLRPPWRETRITLGDTGTIQGTLLTNGKPAEVGKFHVGVMRSWNDQDGRGALPPTMRFCLADANGTFTVKGLAPGKYQVDASPALGNVNSPGKFYSSAMFVSHSGRTVECVVSAGQVTQVTLDTDAQAAPQGPTGHVYGTAFVDGRPATGMAIRGWGRRQLEATVDAAGRFDLGRIETGHINLALVEAENSERFGGSALWSAWFQVEADKDRELKIDVQTASLAGRVLGLDGAPLSGAKVEGYLIQEGPRGPDQVSEGANFTTTTGSNGTFEATRVRSGTYMVHASKAGIGVSPTLRTKAETNAAPLDLRLVRTFVVEGKVDLASSGMDLADGYGHLQLRPVDPGGKGILSAGAQVSSATFRADGTFKLDAIPSGTYSVWAWVNDKECEGTAEVVVADAALSNLTVTLRPKQRPPPKSK